MLNICVLDGHGSGNKLKINGEGELTATLHTHPPRDEKVEGLPFRQFFTDNGASSGSNDMTVNGSSTTQRFYIKASTDFDIYLKTISIQISDNNSSLDKFGALSALTNGVKFYYENITTGEAVISEELKTNLDMVRLGLGAPAFGDGTNAFKADISGGGSDTYLPVVDMSKTFGLPWGLRLVKGSTDKLIFEVRDNLSTIDIFNIIGYGIKLT